MKTATATQTHPRATHIGHGGCSPFQKIATTNCIVGEMT